VYLSQRIAASHDVAGFGCGNVTLDHWVRNASLTADAMGAARTYVWTDENVVIGYFSLCPHEVRRDELPSKLAHGAPHGIPAILLARLALDRSLHGQGLGASLLVDALGRATDAIDIVGGRLIVVDAIDQPARHFYQHHGFRSAPSRPARLFRKASDVAAALRGG
jgi:GNAT superfamily N-acetyltransferase